jgi:hypothetical protein
VQIDVDKAIKPIHAAAQVQSQSVHERVPSVLRPSSSVAAASSLTPPKW